ncbi:MAG TPA: cadherin domain-containing protein [Allosphingosinicella sp.]|jgi:hypothetical protein
MRGYTKSGVELSVNGAGAWIQDQSRVATFADGGFVVVWATYDDTADGNGSAIKAQRFDSAGNKIGGELLVNSSSTQFQLLPAVTTFADGSFAVSWSTSDTAQDGSGYAIKARLFGASGAPLAPEFLVNTTATGNQTASNIVALSNGNFLVSWDDAGSTDVFARLYAADGTALGANFRVNTNVNGTQSSNDTIALAGGGFVAIWRTSDFSQDGSSDSVKGQVFDSSGSRVGGEFLVNSETGGIQNEPSIAALGGGGFVVTWMTSFNSDDGHSNAIKAQVFSATGAKVGAEFLVNTFGAEAQQDPVVAATGGGGFMITWISLDSTQDGAGLALKGQAFDATGARVGTEFLVNTQTTGNQSVADMATLSDGRVIVTWTDTYADGPANWGIKGQIFAADTTPPSPVNQAPVFTSDGGATGSRSVNENIARATTLIAVDPDGEPVTYAIVGGADAALFTIGAQTGRLTFVSTPDFEKPGDSNKDNVYDIIVSATDGSLTGTQALSIAIANVNEPITFSSVNNYLIPEGYGGPFTVSAHDPENPSATMSYRIVGGPDSALFTIDAATGSLTFKSAPDYEAPADAGRDNRYDVTVEASDGVTSSTQAIMFHVSNSNEAPVIGSNGGGAAAALTVAENQTAVTTITATDPDGAATLVYSIVGGADRTRFAINASSGVLTFVSPPNFESRVDVGGNNVYDVTVAVSDGSKSTTQALAVTVSNVNETPTISGSQTDYFHIENRTAVASFSATDPDGTAVTWSIAGGADAAHFAIDPSTGALRFVTAPDFESPADVGADNFYNVTIAASDGSLTATRALTIEIANWNEGPVIVSGGGGGTASVTVAENKHLATTVVADDPDARDSSFTFSIVGGADAALFVIHAQLGQLFFRNNVGGNFEAPGDSDGNNVYEVIVSVSDGFEPADTQAISITVTDANDVPVITSNGGGVLASVSMPENQLSVTTVTAFDVENGALIYSIAGGADAGLFAIDAQSGLLSFVSAPDREAPRDAGANNVYNVTVSVSDGDKSATQQLAVTILDSNEAPLITSNGGGSAGLVVVAENSLAVTNVAATDPEGKALSYAISGGADASRFVIDSTTGALSFLTSPDHEQPADSDADNVYDVIVSASDGAVSGSQSLSIAVVNANERPVIVSNGGGTSAYVEVDEGQTAVTTIVAADPDGAGVLTYSITGGAQADLFVIDAATGALSFAASPDYEAPVGESGNLYSVAVTASDGELSSVQSLQVAVRNVNEGVTITSGAAQSVVENSTAVATLTAQDLDGDAVSFAVSGGADSALFTVDPATGELSFLAAPNFEAPADSNGDNVYEVEVEASDGTLSDTQTLFVTVTNQDEPIAFVSYGGAATVAVSMMEASFATGIVVEARDEEDSAVTYSIAGGMDAESFQIDPLTGILSFVEPNAPDFEDPWDFDSDNVHEVVVAASSSTSSATQAFRISITNRNEAPYLYDTSFSVNEGVKEVIAFGRYDRDGDALAYEISGPDSGMFKLDPATGLLEFVDAPDHEAPLSAAGTNVYTVDIEVSDGEFSSRATFQITIKNVNEGVAINSGGGAETLAVTVAENGTAVTTIAASDMDGDVPTYWITGGADAERFIIDSRTGVLRFIQAPNFDAPGDVGADNVYDVVVWATDGVFTDTQVVTVTVGNVDEPVEIVSYGGAAVVAVNLMEDEFVTGVVVMAMDEEDSPVTYSIAGGADGHQFEIDPTTGALSFMQPNAADFEDPTDSDSDNVHEVIVTASTSTSSATQTFMISIANRNEAPYVYYDSSLTVNEGVQAITTLRGYDRDGDSVTLAIVGGADAALFALDPVTNLLSFVRAPDFEAPLSAAGTNVYDVEIESSDGQLATRTTLEVTIRNVNEGVAITFGGGGETAAVTAFENGTTVANIAASDVDGDVLTYSITGGVDGFRFTIDARTGALRFVHAPNFEAPADVGGNNVYDVVVSVTDGAFTDSQAIAVTVGNVDEPITIASNGGGAGAGITVSENGRAVTTVVAIEADGAPVRYAIAGGQDAAHFIIDAATGQLAFASLPDFEARSDSDADNMYDVVVSASDGVNTDTQVLAVRVADLNEAVEIISNAGGASASVTVAENGTAVTNVAAVDPDGRAVTYAIVGGADAARFTIDAGTGALAFVAAPNFETPADAGADNVYEVVVSASDGTHVDTQALAVTVPNVNEQMAITSNGGGASAALAVTENSAVVTTVVGVDPDGGPVTYVILHGGDSGLFTIDSATGVLSFRVAPDFEAPGDAGGDNVYDVVVMASDGHWSDTQAIAVTVRNAEESVAITSNGGGSSASVSRTENITAVTVVSATDPDGRAVTYAIAGGADASRFTIDAATGALAFISAPNFETPGDAGGDNVYDVVVSASDGTFVDTQAIAVTVGNVNEAPVVTSSGGGAGGAASVVENGLSVVTVTATDPDGTAPTYSIVGGADAARFTINPLTGALQFVAAPDYELPADSDGNNVYAVIVRASDGQLSDDQTLTVTVTNTRDGNSVTGTSGGDSISATSTNVALRTSNEEDTVFGRDGHDTIQGMAGDDDLYGEGGNDVLIGGVGSDRLTGGLGKDQYSYNSVSESSVWARDTILDFSRAQGDKISLSAIDSNSLVSNNQAFTFIGTAAFSNVAGQLRYETWGGVTTISGDVDGDAVADLVIQLSGTITLISSDFIL